MRGDRFAELGAEACDPLGVGGGGAFGDDVAVCVADDGPAPGLVPPADETGCEGKEVVGG